jgi:exosortase
MGNGRTNSFFPQLTGDDVAAVNLRRWILGGVALALIVYAYAISRVCMFQVTPTSLLGWLLVFWGRGGDYAHGYLVPVVAAGVFWWKWRATLRQIPAETSNWGLVVVGLGMLIYLAGVRAQQPRIVAGSLIVLLFGIAHYLGGWRWAKEVWFPCVFLIFMIPLNFLEHRVAFPLRMFVTDFATFLLNLFGTDVYSRGTGIYSRAGRFPPLDVADPCSGIRSLVALMALTSVYGYLVMDKSWKKWVLFAASLPLAVIGNLARITTVALVAQGFGSEIAMKIFHDFSGYIVFSLAILCMLGLGALLNIKWREWLQHWTQEEEPPAPLRR